MEMIVWLTAWLENDDGRILYLLALILSANMIDFLVGWINAKFNKNVEFSSSRAIYGIVRKLAIFVLLVYFIPVALLVPYDVGIGAIYVLYIGYLVSEINSILSHFRLAEDDKTNDLFVDFMSSIFIKKDGK